MTRRSSWLRIGVTLVLLLAACTSTSTDSSGDRGDQALTEPVAAPFDTEFVVASPDGQLRFEIGLDDLARPRYRVIRTIAGADTVVVEDSTLGVETSIGSYATAQEITVATETKTIVDTVDLPHGKERISTVEATTMSLRAGELGIDVWVGDTGVAFRYRIDAPGEAFVVDWERTSFSIPPAHRAWLQQHDGPGFVTPAYERLRSREASAATPPRSTFGYTFPALFADDTNWLLITETALADGAAGSHFSPAVTNGEYLLDLANRGEGNSVGDPRPQVQDSWVSPWRLIITSSDVGDVVESNLVKHLSPPSSVPDAYSWVEPGRVSWSWWSDQTSSRNADAIEPFIDLASEMGWQFSLVDANWDTFDGDRLRELIDYATERDVGLMLWYNSGGPNNAVSEAPRNRMADQATRRAEFERIAALGIRGVKVDFFHSDKPSTIQLYRDILADAADFELMVNFHGSTVPRGWSREFPNLMTMEAVRGGEIHIFDSSYQRVAARQNTVLPFTRNVVGAMDYTPVILGDETLRSTTNSHELALAVVFESPLLHLVDTPQAYLGQPAEVIDLLATVPTVWDETHFIDGTPERHVAIARRLDNQWWIGAVSALDDPLVVSVDLADLGVPTGTPLVQVCDDPDWDRIEAGTYLDPAQYIITTGETPDRISLPLAPNGGCLVRIG